MDKSVTSYVFDKKEPFNLEILRLTREALNSLQEITTVDTFQPSSNEFNDEGLFSTKIFGPVGSKERMEKFAYMDLGMSVLHPLIYKNVLSLKSFYKDIVEGKKYAKFDPKLKDFVEAPITEGETGFNFFIKYLDTLEPPRTSSNDRDNKIKLIKKYKTIETLTDKWLVLPAGIRDYIVTDNKQMEAEINDYYRNILRLSKTAKTLSKTNVNKNDPIYNSVILKLTKAITDLYDYITKILEGKQGLLQGKWAKRGLAHGTRNVITGYVAADNNPDKAKLSFNDTLVGIYQLVNAMTPITVFELKSKFLNNVFDEASENCYLINSKTLKLEQVPVSDKVRKDWLTTDGIEHTLNKLLQDDIKKAPVILDKKYYLYLVIDKGDSITVIRNIDTIDPEDKKYVRPITYVELVFLAIKDRLKDIHGTVTRYPIDSYGSIYISKVKLKVTNKDRIVKYTPYGSVEQEEIDNYPLLTSDFFNSMSVHYSRLEGLGADFDGDKGNFNIILSEEGNKEAKKLLSKREYYITVEGRLAFSSANHITDLTLMTLTE